MEKKISYRRIYGTHEQKETLFRSSLDPETIESDMIQGELMDKTKKKSLIG